MTRLPAPPSAEAVEATLARETARGRRLGEPGRQTAPQRWAWAIAIGLVVLLLLILLGPLVMRHV